MINGVNRKIKSVFVLSLTLIFASILSIHSIAQEGGGRGPEPELGDGATNAGVKNLNEGRSVCGGIPKVYRIDCLRQFYTKAAGTLEAREYSDARRELNGTSRALRKIVNQNVDRDAPQLKVGNRKYKAVKAAVASSLNAQSRQIITESATRLLRSGSKSKQRRSHYTKIAKAFDSTKVILRS